jgi:hypothetical protein
MLRPDTDTTRSTVWSLLTWSGAVASTLMLASLFQALVGSALNRPATMAPTSVPPVAGHGSGEVCDTTGGRVLYIGFSSRIPAEAGAARCPDGIP